MRGPHAVYVVCIAYTLSSHCLPGWQLPAPAQAPGSWLLLVAVALVGLSGARRMLAPLPTWRKRVAVALVYGTASLALLGALLLFAFVMPVYRDAVELRYLSFQPYDSEAAQ